jgi:Ricin-type beta-trefoil lectin domain
MTKFKSIITVGVVFATLLSSLSIINFSIVDTIKNAQALGTTTTNQSTTAVSSATNSSRSSALASAQTVIQAEQSKLATMLPTGKKELKKPISLDYTNPKFENDLSSIQKFSIRQSLRKWKGELPIDNKFTVTSWADIKSDTKDSKVQSKKQNPNTSNSIVVYMWATTLNPNWPTGKVPTEEESESGDPRYTRTEFNVLLKQYGKQGQWSATIERSQELKKESTDIIESKEDAKVIQDLFGTDKNDNKFTGTEEILVDGSSSSSSISSSTNSSSVLSSSTNSSSLSSSSTSKSSFISSSTISSNNSTANTFTTPKPILPVVTITISSNNTKTSSSSNSVSSYSSISSSSSSTNSDSSKPNTTSFLDSILGFGSVKASAGEYDYSWPWKAGDTWTVFKTRDDGKCLNKSFGWHGCGEFSGLDGNGNPSLDLFPPSKYNYTDSYIELLAPVTGTLNRLCADSQNVSMAIGDMRILHVSASDYIGTVGQNISVKKSQKIGKVATQDSIGAGYGGAFNGPSCGSSRGIHTHIKFIANGLNIDGQQIWHYGDYSSFTSNNTNTPPPPTYTNPNTQPINQRNSNYSGFDTGLNFDVVGGVDGNGTQVKLWTNNGLINQKWGYDSTTKEIRGLSNKCLDGGAVWLQPIPSNTYLRLHDCHGGTNQKWQADSSGRIHSLYNLDWCIDAANLNVSGSILYLYNCHTGYNQQWDVWKLGMPTNNNFNRFNKALAYRPNTNLRFDVVGANGQDQTRVQLWQDNGQIHQKWGYDYNSEQIIGLNDKCLDAGNINDPSNRWLRISGCHSGTNQKWVVDTQGRLKTRASDTLCLDSAQSGTNGSWLYMYTCHNGENQTFSSDAGIKVVNYNNYKQLYLSYNSYFVFDIQGASDNDQTPIKLFQRTGNWNQNFTYNGQTQEFRNQNGKCIDGGAMWSTNGWDRGIRINNCHGQSNQKWWIDGSGRIHSNYYVPNIGDTCLDANDGTVNGSFIFSAACNTGGNQRWSGL